MLDGSEYRSRAMSTTYGQEGKNDKVREPGLCCESAMRVCSGHCSTYCSGYIFVTSRHHHNSNFTFAAVLYPVVWC